MDTSGDTARDRVRARDGSSQSSQVRQSAKQQPTSADPQTQTRRPIVKQSSSVQAGFQQPSQTAQQPIPGDTSQAQVNRQQQSTQPTTVKQEPEPEIGRPTGAKEAEFVSQVGESEKVPIVEIKEPGELPTEVASWLERAERDDVAEPPTIVHQGKPIVSPADPQQVKVTLPLDKEELEKGINQKIVESIRWLAEWSVRIIKKFQGRVRYKSGS